MQMHMHICTHTCILTSVYNHGIYYAVRKQEDVKSDLLSKSLTVLTTKITLHDKSEVSHIRYPSPSAHRNAGPQVTSDKVYTASF